MPTFTWVDWFIVCILAVSIFAAARRGFFVAVLSLAGLIAGVAFASWNYQLLAPVLKVVVRNESIADAISFLAIAFAVMLFLGLVGRSLRWAFRSVGLGWLDRLLGAGFGLVQGCFIVTLVLMAVAAFLPHLKWLDDSTLVPYFFKLANETTLVTPAELGERIRQGMKLLQDAHPAWMHRQ